MFKFLPGLILLQLITTGLVILAFRWLENIEIVITLASFAFIVSILIAFWFAAIARDMRKEQLSRMKALHARDREKILLNAERDKASIATESYERINRESRRIHSKANFKVGAAFTAATVAGGLMLLTQFITVGLMLMVGSGAGLAGYLMRIRQERLALGKQPVIEIGRQLEPPQKPVNKRLSKKSK